MFGQLGLSLIFVAITLLINGVSIWRKTDAKSVAVINVITGFVIVSANLIALLNLDTAIDSAAMAQAYLNITAGFLFGFTYIFVAANLLGKLNPEPFGWFCLCVAVFAAVNAVVFFVNGFVGFPWLGVLWILWAVLWLQGFLQFVTKTKGMDKVYPFLAVFEAIFAAGVPAMLMLFNVI